MSPEVYTAFAEFLREKTSISAATTLSALKARVGQGVRVNPAMMQHAETAAAQGLKATPSTVRRTALHAGEAGSAQARMRTALSNPTAQATHARLQAGYDRALSGTPGVFDPSRRLSAGYDHGAIGMATSVGTIRNPTGYSKQHVDALTGEAQWGKHLEHALPDPSGTSSGVARRRRPMARATVAG